MSWAGANPGMAGGPMGGFGPGPASAGIGGMGGGYTGGGPTGGPAVGGGGYGGGYAGGGPTGGSGADYGGRSSATGGLAGPGGGLAGIGGGYNGGYAGGGPTGGSGADYGGRSSATGGLAGPGTAPGSAFGQSKGDFGGPSIGTPGGPHSSQGMNGLGIPGSIANIGLANFPALADAVHAWGRGQSTHTKGMQDRPSLGIPAANTSKDQSRAPSQKANRSDRNFNKSQQRFGDDKSIHIKDQTPMRLVREDPFFFDPTRSPIKFSPPRSPARFGEPPTAQDPGPRGTPAPPGRSAGIPTPEPTGRNISDDVGDAIFGGLRRANDFARDYNARMGFQGSRVGGVGGGGLDDARLLGALLNNRGR